MPAEAIHLSALLDARAAADGEIARLLRAHEREARLGAVLVDLPYFARFGREMLRYVVGGAPTASPWGDRFHQRAPARVGLELLRAARRAPSPRDPLVALALGYLSHVAVDWTLHPLVNRLARDRATRLRSTPSTQHREVEKFQSVLFHERRFGVDLMGTRELVRYIDVDGAAVLADSSHRHLLEDALRAALGAAPTPAEWSTWVRGYRRYARVLGSPLGRLPAPAAAKARERAALYDEPDFDGAYARALACVGRYIDAAFAAFEDDRLADEPAFFSRVREGSIDDPPAGPTDRPPAGPI